MNYGSIPTCENSSISFSDWVYTLKSPKTFMMRLAKQCIMFICHKTFWSNNHLVKIFNSKAFTKSILQS